MDKNMQDIPHPEVNKVVHNTYTSVLVLNRPSQTFVLSC
jgi:hypothetical protein